jgi:hypothetical protein
MLLEVLATAWAFWQWRSMRTAGSRCPAAACQALIGASAGPSVRSVSMRAFMVKPKSPKVS